MKCSDCLLIPANEIADYTVNFPAESHTSGAFATPRARPSKHRNIRRRLEKFS